MIMACTWLMVPLAVLLIFALSARNVELDEAAQTATAGLITLIPEGLVLLMSVTFAVAAVRLARLDTLVQQMAATESLAAVDTICVDKTGTLTDGELKLARVEVADRADPEAAHRALARFAASAGERNRTLEAIARALPGDGRAGHGRGPLLLGVEVERADARRGGGDTYVLGAPDVLAAAGRLELPPELAAQARARTRAPGAGSSSSARAAGAAAGRPGVRAAAAGSTPMALVVLEETLRPDAARDDRVHARAGGRPEADLRATRARP